MKKEQLTHKELFIKTIKSFEKPYKTFFELDALGFDFFEGKYPLVEETDEAFFNALRLTYNEYGIDWIEWWCFENDFGEKGWCGYDGDVEICKTIEDLYDYIQQYRIK